MSSKLPGKLPYFNTSIFSEMSQLANQYGAINLSQGFPEFDAPEFLKNAIQQAIAEGKNQYSPSGGLPELLAQLSELVRRHYQLEIDGAKNVTITSGATEALWVAIQTLVRQGDEVIIFDPAYDAYAPAIELAGGVCCHCRLEGQDYRINWLEVERLINRKTRAIIVNTPHNPTGTLLTQQDLAELQSLVTEHDLYVISDEVYEFITFDGETHESVLRYPELFKRAMVISSFGKTFHCTGWRLGYCVAPVEMTREFRKIRQFVTFASFTPAQFAFAEMLAKHPEHIEALPEFYQRKRDLFVEALSGSRFKILPSKGTYFILLDYSEISTLRDTDFCNWLTIEKGVAAIPLSPFYHSDGSPSEFDQSRVIRLCFAKNDTTLLDAAEILCQL